MQTTERPPTGPGRGTNPARGVVLVAVAVVLGFFVLRAIDDTGAGPDIEVESSGDESATSASPPPAGSDTTAPAPRPPGEVVVVVANASGVQGAAGAQSEMIAAGGYQVLPAGNAEQQDLQTTQVHYVAGYEAEAAKLATEIDAGEGAVQPMPEPPPIELAGAQVLVLLGTDLAGG
jgi:hypothetical protein